MNSDEAGARTRTVSPSSGGRFRVPGGPPMVLKIGIGEGKRLGRLALLGGWVGGKIGYPHVHGGRTPPFHGGSRWFTAVHGGTIIPAYMQ